MKLIKLSTTHFKRLGTFTDGLNIICGENVRGKSSLLQAIEAVLYGVTVVLGKKEHIPTWGPDHLQPGVGVRERRRAVPRHPQQDHRQAGLLGG
ncbi:AAA family ATPase [Pseudomonas sp. JUb52]|uniref:AAA family ATPase n=1 Tax=Pseudomonas sp. JUb52 TaxID=2485127 RepID=UPI00140434B3|nr:AAA family ATPase [Pseudomonas sp. JUb52]